MKCSPPRMSLEEANFGMYINHIYCAMKGFFPFKGENKEGKKKERLDGFNCRVRKILSNKKALLGEGQWVSLDRKEQRLQHFCDEIVDILFNRRKDLREMKIKDENERLSFLNQVFDFFLSEKNLPNFISLIFSLVNGGNIFTKEGGYEKDRKWLDSFEFKI